MVEKALRFGASVSSAPMIVYSYFLGESTKKHVNAGVKTGVNLLTTSTTNLILIALGGYFLLKKL